MQHEQQPTQANPAPTPTFITNGFAWQPYALLAVSAVLFVALLFADRTTLNTRNTAVAARDGKAPKPETVTLNGLTLPAPAHTIEGEVVERLARQLAESQTPDEKKQLLGKLVAASINAQRMDMAAAYQEELYRITEQEGDLTKAIAHYKQALPAADSAVTPQLATRAAALYDQFIAKHPTDLEAQIDRSVLLTQSAAPMQGVLALRTLAEKNPNNYRAQYQLGLFSLRTSQFDKAVGRFEQALRLQPTSAEAALGLGDAHRGLGQTQQAQTAYRRALSLTTDNALRARINQALTSVK
jgi:tetratricopeptide (TPR) repeat protein